VNFWDMSSAFWNTNVLLPDLQEAPAKIWRVSTSWPLIWTLTLNIYICKFILVPLKRELLAKAQISLFSESKYMDIPHNKEKHWLNHWSCWWSTSFLCFTWYKENVPKYFIILLMFLSVITTNALAICIKFQRAVHFCSKVNGKLIDCVVNCLNNSHQCWNYSVLHGICHFSKPKHKNLCLEGYIYSR
jgi:hypothetical protein